MASTMAVGLDYIAKTQIKQILDDLKSDNSDYVATSYPLIYTTNQNYQNPYGNYQGLDNDKTIQKTVSKYVFYKLIDKWLYTDLKDLLAFIKISDGKPQLIRNINDYKPESLNSESVESIEKRIDYMEHIILDKKLVKHVLKKIVRDRNIRWYHLNKHSDLIKKTFYKYLKSKLTEAIDKYNRQ